MNSSENNSPPQREEGQGWWARALEYAQSGPGARQGGLKNVADVESRGGESRADAPERPRDGRQSRRDNRRFSVATTWLSSLSEGSDPTAGKV